MRSQFLDIISQQGNIIISSSEQDAFGQPEFIEKQPMWKTLINSILAVDDEASSPLQSSQYSLSQSIRESFVSKQSMASRQSTFQIKLSPMKFSPIKLIAMKKSNNPTRSKSITWAIQLLPQRMQPQKIIDNSDKQLYYEIMMVDLEGSLVIVANVILERHLVNNYNFSIRGQKLVCTKNLDNNGSQRLPFQVFFRKQYLFRAKSRKDVLQRRATIIKQIQDDEKRIKDQIGEQQKYEEHNYIINGSEIIIKTQETEAIMIQPKTNQKNIKNNTLISNKTSKTSPTEQLELRQSQKQIVLNVRTPVKVTQSQKRKMQRPQMHVYGGSNLHNKTVSQFVSNFQTSQSCLDLFIDQQSQKLRTISKDSPNARSQKIHSEPPGTSAKKIRTISQTKEYINNSQMNFTEYNPPRLKTNSSIDLFQFQIKNIKAISIDLGKSKSKSILTDTGDLHYLQSQSKKLILLRKIIKSQSSKSRFDLQNTYGGNQNENLPHIKLK